MTLKELIERCKRNERLAQQEFYNLYKSRLMGVCRRYSRSREEAQDILQQAFFKILTKISTLENNDRIESWMIRLTINTALNNYKASLKVRNEVDLKEDPAATNDDAFIVSQLTNEEIVQLINALPDSARMVFNLFAIEGYSHKEISSMMEISEGTSRSQLFYARSLLKAQLKKMDDIRVKYA
jgi:RNA polymerase sigma factor (sigma-70 family)